MPEDRKHLHAGVFRYHRDKALQTALCGFYLNPAILQYRRVYYGRSQKNNK